VKARRRRYSAVEKRRLLDEAEKPGESVSTVALKNALELVREKNVMAVRLPTWVDDYNHVRPHKGLKMVSPVEFRNQQLAS